MLIFYQCASKCLLKTTYELLLIL